MQLRAIVLFVVLAAVATSASAATVSLKEVFKDRFLVGVALNAAQFSGNAPSETQLVREHFNSITAENVQKWFSLQPRPGEFTFEASDRFVDFGTSNAMAVIGHTLVWHSQTPQWVFRGTNDTPATREELLGRMRDHITTVVGRYRGRIRGWDVVNEALGDDGSLRSSPWLRIIGEDYLVKAFEYAHAADPEAELYYNDYSLENRRKREGAVRLITRLKEAGVRITGVGLQGHYGLTWPPIAEVEETIATFQRLGLQVMITELDVDVLPRPEGFQGADVGRSFAADPKMNPYREGLPEEIQQALAKRYADLFRVFLKSDALRRVTFWGVTDRTSWLNHFPVRGRTNHPLLFDREGRPKPAFEAVTQAGQASSQSL